MGIREIIAFVFSGWAASGLQCYAQARAAESTTKSGAAGWNAVANGAANLASAAGIGLTAAQAEFAARQALDQAIIDNEKTAAAALAALPPVTCAGPTPPPAPPTGAGS